LNSSSDEPGGEELLVVGRILRPHGIRGAVVVRVESDRPGRFAEGARLVLETASGDRREVTVQSCSEHRDGVLVNLPGLADRETAEKLKGSYLLVRARDADLLAKGEHWAHDLLGMRVLSEEGLHLGEVSDVVCRTVQDTLVVRDAGGMEFRLPFVGEFVKKVDPVQKVITVKVIEGMVP
jgi:16S rRNA processing protein RimM